VDFSEDQIYRYARHIILPEVGGEGQKKLLESKVLLLGAGGLGSPVALYLAAAGVGTIGIVDFDIVDRSNLQRQIIHTTADLDRPKLESARDKMVAMNPDINVVLHNLRLDSTNVKEVFRDYSIIVDGTDNFPTRYLVNDAAVLAGKAVVHGSIFRFEGQVTVFKSPDGPCYRCLYPEPPPPGMVPSCQEAGVLGVLPGVIGSLQAVEVIKLIIGKGDPLIGKLLLYDALKADFRKLNLRRDPKCVLCGENPSVTELIDYVEFCGVPGS
jgi:adenylyltransferase/sulfurtransferase